MSSPSPLSRFSGSSSSSNKESNLISTSIPTAADEPTPIDLLLKTPPAVLRLLTLASPIIESSLILVQLITWTHPSFFSSLLILLSWWSICLFGPLILHYGLPSLLLVYILANYISNISNRNSTNNSKHHHYRPLTLTPASYSHLLQSSQTLASYAQSFRINIIFPIKSHLSFVPYQAGRAAPVYHTAWFAVTSYPFYLILTWLIPMRLILLIAGSIGILWNAPFFRNVRFILWQSAAVRWSCRMLIGLLSGGRGLKKEWSRTKSGVGIPGLLGNLKVSKGEERPVKTRSNSSVTNSSSSNNVTTEGNIESPVEAEEEEGDDVKLQFTVFENQRWWVGLDWTHALLPGERASWTDPALNPSSPPASFTLPPPTILYTPCPTRSDPNARLKTTTEWKWLDPEWKVQRNSTAPLSPTPATPPLLSLLPKSPISINTKLLPIPTLPPTSNLIPTSTTSPIKQSSSTPTTTTNSASASSSIKSEELSLQDWQVDEDGWQYGDNHFEKMGPKGGLGKYTRRRAWVRSAGLVERCEKVGGGGGNSNSESNQRIISSTTPSTNGNGMTSSTSSTSLNGTPGVISTGMTRVGSLKVRRESGSKERSSSAGSSSSEKRSDSPSVDGDARRRKSSSSTLKNSTSVVEE